MSNGNSGLALLARERDNILLAQVSALLHDVGKFCNRHYEVHSFESQNLSPKPQFAYKVVVDNPGSVFSLHGTQQRNDGGIFNELNDLLNITGDKAADYLEAQQKQALLNTRFVLHGTSFSLAELIMLARPGFARPSILRTYLGKDAWTIAVLGACHREAHYDKQEPQGGQQSIMNVLTSTPFGFEDQKIQVNSQPGNLTLRLKSLPSAKLGSYKTIAHILKQELGLGLGDTRRPINEVDLWSWSSSVEALFKALITSSLLTSPLTDLRQVSWRLLNISLDGLSFLERAPTISDLVGRRAALQAALDDVRELLEVTYPLGNEVYRDENGSAFVAPALDGDDAQGNRLRGLIESHILDTLRQGELGSELRPRVHITKADKQAAVLHEALKMPPPPVAPFQDSLRCWWQGEAADICTTCGVRPQGWGAPSTWHKEKAQRRNVCYVCLERRGKRAQLWAQARHKTGDERKPWERTIWLDEVADEHDRLALVVGKFDLSQWLNGEMIQTLLVVCDPNNNDPQQRFIPKNPSFARIQRVWRTTQQFWQAVQDEDIAAVTTSKPQYRLEIAVTNAGELADRLGHYHVYDAEVGNRRLSVVWDSQDQLLLTADNLAVWARTEIDSAISKPEGESASIRLARSLLAALPDEIPLFEPVGYGQQRRDLPPARLDRQRSNVFPVAYTPTIDLLTQPASFMALAPARNALDVATKISHRYELEMSKVRNRLPLFLGLVFFDRRQPLFSALDAGRRMLQQSFEPQACIVAHNHIRLRRDAPCYLDHPHFEQWREIQLEESDQQHLVWRAGTVMGDGNTCDDWYPYVHVQQDKDGNAPGGRPYFEQPENSGRHWVHVKDVQDGDRVCFAPSYFSWLHLDTSARRFEAGETIFVLEELDRITALWKKLQDLAAANKLSESQLHAVVTLLAAKEQSWGASSNEYRQLAQTILSTEGLAEGPEPVTMEDLTSGRFQRTFELYHRILKQRL
jgi:hypothetical protein